MKVIPLIVLLTFGLLGCTIPASKQAVEKDQMICHYYTSLVEVPFAYGCDMIMNDSSSNLEVFNPVQDTVITNRNVLDSISKMVSSLKKSNDSEFGSACLVCMLEYHAKRTLICIDWFSNILVNHKPVARNDTLSLFIKRNIGFYEHYTPENGFLPEWFPEYKLFNEPRE